MTIYIVIPFIDALLYLYNILFHLAIAYALAQILSLLIGSLLVLIRCLIAWRLQITFNLIKTNIFRVYGLFSRPLILVYRFLLAGVWITLYWFLSMGKALFAQWNYSELEADHLVRFSGNFLVKFEQETIKVCLNPSVNHSSVSSQLIRLYEYFWVRLDGDHVCFKLKDQIIKLWISSESEESVITFGADALRFVSSNESPLTELIRKVLLFKSVHSKPLELVPVHNHESVNQSEINHLTNEDSQSQWIVEQHYYPFGWRHIVTCRYWFSLRNFIFLAFFIVYGSLLAVIYFCLIAPHEFTLISIQPTMFRYIGNFVFYASRQ